MASARFRFYAELNDFLPRFRRQQAFDVEIDPPVSVKHVVESLGVAHTEVDLILANGRSVDFSYRVEDGDQVSVYPVFEALDISPLVRLRPAPLREPRFVLDVHLGRLAAYLRLLGFDTLYPREASDEMLAEISSAERRILLTRDRRLLMRSKVTHGCLVHASLPQEQAAEVIRRLDLSGIVRPFRRCLRCNGKLEPVEKAAVEAGLPHHTRETYDNFYRCADCRQVYWAGAHYPRMKRLVDELVNNRPTQDEEAVQPPPG